MVKPKRTLLTIVNDDWNKIADTYPRETFVRLYDGNWPLPQGFLVKVEGTFWIEKGMNVMITDCTGVYRVNKSGRSPTPEYDQVYAELTRVLPKERAFIPVGPYLVLPEQGSY